MNKIKLILVFILLTSVAILVAAPITLIFRDTSQATKNLTIIEAPTYPNATPTTYPRFVVQAYKSIDGVIDPLGADGLPTGDDIAITTTGGSGTLAFGPTGTWSTSPNLTALDPVAEPVMSSLYHTSSNKLYFRVFNATNIAEATKYFQSTSLYTVLSSSVTVTYIPTYGWSAWINKTVTPLISGAITSALPVNGVTVACTGLPSYLTTATGLFNFSVPTGATITITPTKTGYYFTPTSHTLANVQEAVANVDFVMTKSAPNVASNPIPANSSAGVNPTIGQVAWDFMPLEGYALPTGFKVYFPDNATPVFVPYSTGVTHYSFGIPLLAYNTIYGWKVVPTNDNPGKGKTDDLSAGKILTGDGKADASDVITWSFTTKNPSYITPGITESIDPDGAGPLGTFLFNTPEATELVPTPVIEYSVVPLTSVPFFWGLNFVNNAFALNLSTNLTTDHTPLSVTVPAGTWYGIVYYGGTWHQASPYPATGPGTITWADIPFTSDVQLVLSGGYDPTLPVELSSFTANYTTTPTGSFFVELTWVVQSETNHMGYYILRNTSDALNTAISLNPTEPITNGNSSGSQITYAFRDVEIDHNSTYYYWLESADLDGTHHFFGPITVIVGGTPEEPTPLVPTITALLDAYPNPFGLSTTLPYTLKTAADVKLEVYNVKGQKIWSSNVYQDKAGYYKTQWLGQDMNGKAVSSGIYYYRMTSGKYTASKKIVLVK